MVRKSDDFVEIHVLVDFEDDGIYLRESLFSKGLIFTQVGDSVYFVDGVEEFVKSLEIIDQSDEIHPTVM